jgi:hypothetical protein
MLGSDRTIPNFTSTFVVCPEPVLGNPPGFRSMDNRKGKKSVSHTCGELHQNFRHCLECWHLHRIELWYQLDRFCDPIIQLGPVWLTLTRLQKTPPFLSFPCLSRACLGKMITFCMKWFKNGAPERPVAPPSPTDPRRTRLGLLSPAGRAAGADRKARP